jgi:hypothetical protein
MKFFNEKERSELEVEINHILESGANSIRLIKMFDDFVFKRNFKRDFASEVMGLDGNRGDPNCKLCGGKGYHTYSDFSGRMTFTNKCDCIR